MLNSLDRQNRPWVRIVARLLLVAACEINRLARVRVGSPKTPWVDGAREYSSADYGDLGQRPRICPTEPILFNGLRTTFRCLSPPVKPDCRDFCRDSPSTFRASALFGEQSCAHFASSAFLFFSASCERLSLGLHSDVAIVLQHLPRRVAGDVHDGLIAGASCAPQEHLAT